MFNKIIILLPLLVLCCINFAQAQGELETQREPDNYNINSYGVKLNSNGYGLYYSFSHRINYRLRNFIESEYNYQKHTKEIKVINPYFDSYTIRKFVFGKTNTVHNLKFGYGYNRMLFEKRDKKSISIHFTGSIGAILSLSKPIYYEIVDSVFIRNQKLFPYTSYDKVDINFQNNPTDIIGKAPFNMGLDEIKLIPGIYAKFGFQFDFSQNVMKTQVLETGVILDSYLTPVEIMAGKQNRFFLNFYISYHFGKKYDVKLNRDYRKEQRKNQRQFQ